MKKALSLKSGFHVMDLRFGSNKSHEWRKAAPLTIYRFYMLLQRELFIKRIKLIHKVASFFFWDEEEQKKSDLFYQFFVDNLEAT